MINCLYFRLLAAFASRNPSRQKAIMKKIIKTVLILLLLAVIAIAVWQWDNISLLWRTLTTDSETISRQLEQVSEANRKKLEEDYNITVPQLTKEQTDQLLDGSKSHDEVLKELGLHEEKNAGPTDASGIIEKYTAKLVAYRVELMAKLGGIKQEYLDKWYALPESERTSSRKTEFIKDGVHLCYTIEVESDARVVAILDQLEQELKAIGADTSVRDVLWKQYTAEKAAEESYYLKKYLW